jgi:hypothetical protein
LNYGNVNLNKPNKNSAESPPRRLDQIEGRISGLKVVDVLTHASENKEKN